VAYVESVISDGSITVSEDNFSAGPSGGGSSRSAARAEPFPERWVAVKDLSVFG